MPRGFTIPEHFCTFCDREAGWQVKLRNRKGETRRLFFCNPCYEAWRAGQRVGWDREHWSDGLLDSVKEEVRVRERETERFHRAQS